MLIAALVFVCLLACQVPGQTNSNTPGFTDGTADIPTLTGDQGAVLVQLPSPTTAARSAISSTWAASNVDTYMVIVYNDTKIVGGQTLADFTQVHWFPSYYTMDPWSPSVALALDPGTYRVVAFAGKRANLNLSSGTYVFLMATATANVTITKGNIAQVSAQFKTVDLSITTTANCNNPSGVFYAGQQFGVTFAGSYGATAVNKGGATFTPVRMALSQICVHTRFASDEFASFSNILTGVFPSEPSTNGSWSAQWVATAPAQASDDCRTDGVTAYGDWQLWFQGGLIEIRDADSATTSRGVTLSGTYTQGGLSSLTSLYWQFPYNMGGYGQPDPNVPAGQYGDWFQVGPNNASVKGVTLHPSPTGAEFTFTW